MGTNAPESSATFLVYSTVILHQEVSTILSILLIPMTQGLMQNLILGLMMDLMTLTTPHAQ